MVVLVIRFVSFRYLALEGDPEIEQFLVEKLGLPTVRCSTPYGSFMISIVICVDLNPKVSFSYSYGFMLLKLFVRTTKESGRCRHSTS